MIIYQFYTPMEVFAQNVHKLTYMVYHKFTNTYKYNFIRSPCVVKLNVHKHPNLRVFAYFYKIKIVSHKNTQKCVT